MAKERNIILCLIFSFFTFGLYNLYWKLSYTDELNKESNGEYQTTGLTVLFLTIITFGFYIFYWAYKMGGNYDILRKKRGIYSDGSGLLFIVLLLFSLGIMIDVLVQNELNIVSKDNIYN